MIRNPKDAVRNTNHPCIFSLCQLAKQPGTETKHARRTRLMVPDRIQYSLVDERDCIAEYGKEPVFHP